MSLAVAQITAAPIQIPVYRNERIRSFADWFRDNDAAITAYYNALRPFAEEGTEPLVDFFEFAAIAHEREEFKAVEARS